MTVLGGLQVDGAAASPTGWCPAGSCPAWAARWIWCQRRAARGRGDDAHREGRAEDRARAAPAADLGAAGSLIVTELAVIEPTPDGLLLRERAPGVSVAPIVRATEAELLVPDEVPEMVLG